MLTYILKIPIEWNALVKISTRKKKKKKKDNESMKDGRGHENERGMMFWPLPKPSFSTIALM